MVAENGHAATPPMIYRRLGSTGLKVSVLSYGAWVTFGNQLNVSEAQALLKQCYDAGINFFDNAETYAKGKAEEIMGEALENLNWPRSSYVVSTKIFWGATEKSYPNVNGLSRKHIIEGTKAAIKRLRVEYVDLVFCHRPDVETPIEETVRAMNWVIDQGLAFYWGTSEWTEAQIREAWSVAQRLNLQGPAMEQPQYNLFERQKVEGDYAGLYKEYGLGTTIWSPLASGLLSGKYGKDNIPEGSRFSLDQYKGMQKNIVDEKMSKIDSLRPIAKSLDCTLAQLSIAWCAKNEDVSTVILGGTKSEQLHDNFGALAVIPKLTPEIMQQIDDIFKNKPAPPPTYK